MAQGTLTGILIDVSGSMKYNAIGNVDDEGEWVRSLFQVIDDLIKNDVRPEDQVFTIGFGGQSNDGTFDIQKSIKSAQRLKDQSRQINKHDSIEEIFQLLERAGARHIRKWTTVDQVYNYITQVQIHTLLTELHSNYRLARRIVDECLPPACKGVLQEAGLGFLDIWGGVTSFASNFRQATDEDIKEAVASAMALVQIVLPPIDIYNAVTGVNDAAKTIRGTATERELTEKRRRELLDLVKPYIYGGTPIESALRSASEIFRRERSDKVKMMVVISDGDWANSMSFTRMFEGKGWTFDIEKNKTKLFAHVNNPEHMREICRIGKSIVCNQDVLSDLLVTVSMDIYINQSNTGISASEQDGGTCYANASATAIHLSLKRILGRDGGYPDFDVIRDELVREFGSSGANTFNVLRNVCQRYRLRCSEISANEVFKAIAAKRIVVAKFHLTNSQWDQFKQCYKRKPDAILTRKYLDRWPQSSSENRYGHAVVVTSYTSNCLILMNSWGDEFADKGFFRVASADVLGLKFMDVYWTDGDLSFAERTYYKEHGSEVAQLLVEKLHGLQVQKYTCPIPRCGKTSSIDRFTGTLLRAICPECRQSFSCSEAGNILAMNIYLTSIATKQISADEN